jgi:hypothetical protein
VSGGGVTGRRLERGCVIRKNQDDDDDDNDDDDPSTQGTKCGAQMLFSDL